MHTEAGDTDAFTQKDLDNILCTTKLAQSTSQYFFVLESLHTVLPSTTLYYKACTKHFPVLLCTTKLARIVQSTSKHYFVLQSLHKVLPSTTLYYKACAKYFPMLLCTRKLAHSTSQYYFVLQSLHKALPSTTLYYRACTNHYRSVDAATPIRFTKSSCKTQKYSSRSRGAKQPSCSHYPAICDQRANKRIELRTHEKPLVAEHSGGTDYAPNRAQTHPPHTHEVPFIAGRRHFFFFFTQKNTRFRAAAFPTQVPCNIHAAITLRSATRESTNE